MVVLILERVKPALRGELSRWLIEPRAGVFVGNLSGLVRDRLWEKICEEAGEGAALLIQTARTEQGFLVRTHGDLSRELVDVEGLTLVRIPGEQARKRQRRARGGVVGIPLGEKIRRVLPK